MDEAKAMLPLDVPRVVVLKKGDHLFTYNLSRVTLQDWQKYFGNIVHQTINRGDVREQVFDSDAALVELVTSTVDKVEGYGELSGDWKPLLPVRHRLAVGLALRSVGPSDEAEESFALSELVEIRLDAMWSASEDGTIRMYKGLVHRFRQPSIEQLKRYNCEAARVRISGSAESGVTTFPLRQAIAMKLYDELIESVDGYSVRGGALVGKEAIAREMDGAHKAMAALALFAGEGDVSVC